jgi:hypothetical protein
MEKILFRQPTAAVTFRDRLIAEAETLVRFPHRRSGNCNRSRSSHEQRAKNFSANIALGC